MNVLNSVIHVPIIYFLDSEFVLREMSPKIVDRRNISVKVEIRRKGINQSNSDHRF